MLCEAWSAARTAEKKWRRAGNSEESMSEASVSKRLRNSAAASYLSERGFPVSPKTLTNRRCAGTGPPVQYFGSVPL
jgi:hypothetical protein